MVRAGRVVLLCLAAAVLSAAVVLGAATVTMYDRMRHLRPEILWRLPTRVYSKPFALARGVDVAKDGLAERLNRLGYRPVRRVENPGEYTHSAHAITIFLRGGEYAGARLPPGRVRLVLNGFRVESVVCLDSPRGDHDVFLEPEVIATLYDEGFEDREILRMDRCPPVLVDAVLSVEDERFYRHRGIDVRALVRAALADVGALRIEEGGSTITQQLVKNLFLTQERTLARKMKEAWLALVMEAALTKDEILAMYLNEVYLGRYGYAGIYGMARASRVFFDKDVSSLELHEAALLAGLIRSPNRTSPYAHPKAALMRRNTVLRLMAAQGRITREEYNDAVSHSLGVVPFRPPIRRAPYFVDYALACVRSRLPDEAMRSGGLKIDTTLDVHAQLLVEEALTKSLEGMAPDIQAACVVVGPMSGEILAMTGGRDYRMSQFNRAVALGRNIGSLVKPAVYYAALESGRTLASPIDDSPVSVTMPDGSVWAPKNHDGSSHGCVLLADGLVHSLNQATVRLGMEVGVDRVGRVVKDLIPGRDVFLSPALLLGAVSCSPLDVAGMYAVFAAGGTYNEPSCVRAVSDAQGRLLYRREPVRGRRILDARIVFLVNAALQDVLCRGTGRMARRYGVPEGACGKTGTTNDLRDSWFAAYTQDFAVVAWVGADDFRPVGLTGAEGALPIGARIMAGLGRPWNREPPAGVRFFDVDATCTGIKGDLSDETIRLPFIEGTEPPPRPAGLLKGILRSLRSLLPF